MSKTYYVYIMTNWRNTVFYAGVTSNLVQRVSQHKQKLIQGFTAKYNVTKLVFYESTNGITAALAREKQIKAGSRQKKIDLVNSINPEWRDLSDEW